VVPFWRILFEYKRIMIDKRLEEKNRKMKKSRRVMLLLMPHLVKLMKKRR
jgi:hypothetical protein